MKNITYYEPNFLEILSQTYVFDNNVKVNNILQNKKYLCEIKKINNSICNNNIIDDNLTCSICLSEFNSDTCDIDNNIYMISCKHCFHGKCINNWLNKKTNCPLCRKKCELYNNEINEFIFNNDDNIKMETIIDEEEININNFLSPIDNIHFLNQYTTSFKTYNFTIGFHSNSRIYHDRYELVEYLSSNIIFYENIKIKIESDVYMLNIKTKWNNNKLFIFTDNETNNLIMKLDLIKINIIIDQIRTTPENAIKALIEENNDLVNALLSLQF